MSCIKILPEILANKIAAGEIVERPASAVKELVENSLDAACRSIHVSVVSGGKRLIRVRDDGVGMSRDDALLAFEHHATSKLRSAEDLASIATLGFRGEALPSIASISRLTLRTRREEDAVGTEIEIHGGVLRSVKQISWDRGTEIEARDLFYNVPARRKFLRSHDTELGHIARLVTHYSLSHHETRFTLEHEGRTLLDATAAPDTRDRIYQVFGDGFLDFLIPFEGQCDSIRAHGFTSLPRERRTNSYALHLFVNRRMVRDKVLMGAIRQAYQNRVPTSAYPVTILFLDLPFDEVDVNAHPAKTEIRFRDQTTVHRLTFETIDRALKENIAIPSYVHRFGSQFPPGGIGDSPGVLSDITTSSTSLPEIPKVADVAAAQWNLMPSNRHSVQPPLNYPLPSVPFAKDDFESTTNKPADVRHDAAETPVGQEQRISERQDISGARILGQMRDSYIIACDSQGLLIVDQHAAHERILYEKLTAEMFAGHIETQRLLIPLTLELTPAQTAVIERAMPVLERNGFEVEPFGGSSIIVRSVPVIAHDADLQTLLVETIEDIDESNYGLDIDKIRDRITVKTACHAAVKVNMPLSQEKMRRLLDDLAQTSVPTNCPHGRPAIMRFTFREIEKNFGRS